MAQSPKPASPRVSVHELSKEDDAAIRKVLVDYDVAWNTHNMKALDRVFCEDAEFVNVVGMHWRGRADIIAAHAAYHATIFKDVGIKTDTIDLRPLSADIVIAVVTCTQDTFTTPGGEVVKQHQNKLSYVFTKTGGEWRIAHGQNVRIDAEAAKHDPVNSKDGAAEEDLKTLQGMWITMRLVSDGKVEIDLKEPPKEGPVSTLTYNGHKWVLKVGDQEFASGTSKFDPSKSPKHIDLFHESGPLKGQTVLGIYKLVGDEYTGCIAAPGKARPTEFASQAGGGQRLVISKREKLGLAQTPKPDLPMAATNAISKENDEAIRRVIAGTVDSLNAHDMKTFVKHFRDDAEWINMVGMHWRGRDAILTAHLSFLETVFKNNRMKIDAIETRSVGSGYALAVATITHGEFTAPSGKLFPAAQNRATHFLAKGADGWKIVHSHNVQVDAEAAKHDPVNSPKK